MRGDIIQLCCLYTKHKTQKRKTWIDGRLVVDKKTNQVYLYDANPPPGSLDAVLDQAELTKTETTNIIERSETVVESEKYLITIEGPWINNEKTNSKVLQSKNNFTSSRPKMSAGMQKLMNRKFRKPSAYIPPPPDQKKRKVITRKPPLQPGDVERQYYEKQNLINNQQKQSHTDGQATSIQIQRFQQQNSTPIANFSNRFVEDINKKHSNTCEKLSDSQTNKFNHSRQDFRDAPEYNSLSYYGEENDTDNDSDSECESHGKNSSNTDLKINQSLSNDYSDRVVNTNQNQQMQPHASIVSNSCTLDNNHIERGYQSVNEDSDKVDSTMIEINSVSNHTQPGDENKKPSTLSKSDLLAMFGDQSHRSASVDHENSNHDTVSALSCTDKNQFNESHQVLQESRSIQVLNSFRATSSATEKKNSQHLQKDEMYSTKQVAVDKTHNDNKKINEITTESSNPVQFHLLSSSGESSDESSEESSCGEDN